MKSVTVTGIIPCEDGKVAFWGNDFVFSFYMIESDKSSLDRLLNSGCVIKADDNGFVWGITDKEHRIAIYSGKDIDVNPTKQLHTWLYIVSEHTNINFEQMNCFSKMRFENGVLKSLYPGCAISRVKELSQDSILSYKLVSDKRTIPLQKEEEKVSWEFKSRVSERLYLSSGYPPLNIDSLLEIGFEKNKNLGCFVEYLQYVSDLCAFLTFRSEPFFEKIRLYHEGKVNSHSMVYIKKDARTELRGINDVISIHNINDAVLYKIIANIMHLSEEYPGFPFSFISVDERSTLLIGADKIRNICSSLEMELNIYDKEKNQNKLKSLTDRVKEVIKEHRQSEDKFTDTKIYDYIYSNIALWNAPLAKRIIDAWNSNKDSIMPVLNRYDLSIEEADLTAFVKARNGITHNGSRQVDMKITNTAFSISGLIYCLALSRVGFSKEQIQDILGSHFIG